MEIKHFQLHSIQFDFCLLIPCYNNFEGLIKSLHSISYSLNQFFILIVDDGSKEPIQLQTVKQHINTDCKIEIVRLEKNEGIINALNKGLEWILKNISAKYIARLDCGDICNEHRFYIQTQFLDAHSNINLIGSWCVFQKPDSNFYYSYITPTQHKNILRALHFRNVFIHPTVMFRTELIQQIGGYENKFKLVEDYALFWKMAKHSETAIIDKFLVTCEINEKGLSITNRKKQLKGRMKVVWLFGNLVTLKILGLIKLILLLLLPYKLLQYVKKCKEMR